MSEKSDYVVLSKSTIKRIVSDVKDLKKSPLEDQGIYYHHDEGDILRGYAYITGPKGSLYYGGSYLYTFSFPTDYPHSPPVAYYHTNDGETRFHPNMYKNGKVCLSILNTWRGEPWSGCQTIRSILLTILSVLDEKPFLHEPGITELHCDYRKYHDIVLFKNLSFSSFIGLSQTDQSEMFNGFPVHYFKESIEKVQESVEEDLFNLILDKLNLDTLCKVLDIEDNKAVIKEEDIVSGIKFIDQHDKMVYVGAYRMSCCINWYKLYAKYRRTFRLYEFHKERRGDNETIKSDADNEEDLKLPTK